MELDGEEEGGRNGFNFLWVRMGLRITEVEQFPLHRSGISLKIFGADIGAMGVFFFEQLEDRLFRLVTAGGITLDHQLGPFGILGEPFGVGLFRFTYLIDGGVGLDKLTELNDIDVLSGGWRWCYYSSYSSFRNDILCVSFNSHESVIYIGYHLRCNIGRLGG